MNYAAIKPVDIANGEGVRVSLFVSGCRHHCKNCFNPQTWNFCYGNAFSEQTIDDIIQQLSPDYVTGLTVLGGEPLEPENQAAVKKLIAHVKQQYPNKTIWVYTGFVLETELLGESRAHTQDIFDILSQIDVLVDGRFMEELKDITLKFRGSSNQRIIDMQKTLQTGQICLHQIN